MSESISQLPAATSSASTDIVPVTQGSTGPGTGTTRYATVAQILASGGSPIIATNFRVNGATGPTWTAGTGAPTSSQPFASIYSRTDGSTGSTAYLSQGSGTWTAVTGVDYRVNTSFPYYFVQSGHQLVLPGSMGHPNDTAITINNASGTGTISLTGLPPQGSYSVCNFFELTVYARNPGTGARTGAIIYLGTSEESGAATVSVAVTNIFGTEWGAGIGTLQVSATCASDASSITVTITNTDASNSRQVHYISQRYLG